MSVQCSDLQKFTRISRLGSTPNIHLKTQNVEVETIGHRYHKRQKLVSIEFMNFMEVLQLNQKGIFNLCNIDQRSDHEYLADL